MSKDTKELPKPIESHNHGLDLLHPSLRPQTRFMLGHLAIAGDLTTGSSDGLSDSLRRAGYADPEEFWEGSLSEPMTIDDFIFFISSLNFSPQMNAPDAIKITLRDLLKQAAQTEQAFVLKTGLIDPRGAVIWLLSMPRRRSLIPVELAQHIERPKQGVLLVADVGKEVAADAEKSSPPRRRRQATQVPDVQRALLELYPSGEPANRTAMQKAVEGHLCRKFSLSTLDRARKKAWPVSSNVIS